MRLRRSELSSPGSNPSMMRKALVELPADEVFLDLEDSVAPKEKVAARGKIVEALKSNRPSPGKTVVVRINSLRTQWWYRDLIDVLEGAGEKIDCVMIPKVEGPEEVKAVEQILAQYESSQNLGRRIGLEVQIETAKGLALVESIAFSSERLESLIFGPGDYAASLGMRALTIGAHATDYPGHIWGYPMYRIVNAAKAAGLQAIDGPYAIIQDLRGFEESARMARHLGYDGKWAIHPEQIGVCNKIFSPTPEEVEKAQRIISEYDKATQAEGRGAIAIEGEMVDAATYRIAVNLVNFARKIGIIK